MATITAIKERPILMHARSIRGILDGRKTQTRRIIKGGRCLCYLDTVTGLRDIPLGMCPYGQPGDRLWVRETWMPDGADCRQGMMAAGGIPKCVLYRANPEDEARVNGGFKWRPSIHMPRWASRLTLEITNIRVERIQDISKQDVIAEGFHEWQLDAPYVFPKLWDDTNGKGAWDRNEWCWVIEFKVAQ